jgi:Tol biopolymer transport system component/GH35 family endo-1,4-beta-xylanase
MKVQTQMKRPAIIGGGMLVVVALAVAGLAFFYTQSTEEVPPPILAFASDRSGAGDIFILDQAGEISNLTNNPSADWDPVWSADGTMLAFTSHRSGNSEIWLLETVQTNKAESQPRNLTNHPGWDYSPTWSPSGQSVAFVSERDGDPEIFAQNLEGNAAIQLTFNEEMDRLPAWSPDGQYIAFAGVRSGVEEIFRIRPDGTDEQILTFHPLKGTAPAWSPDSQRLAFVGWDEEDEAGIYIIGPDLADLELIYQQGGAWLGSLGWSADGRWLTFTSWKSGNHELYALPATGGVPVQLTVNDAWDDFLSINPVASFAVASRSSIAQAAPALNLPPNPDLAAGVNLADLSLTYLINDLGFDWAKGFVNWATVEPEPGTFRWIDPDNIIRAFSDQGVKTLLRVHGTPAWARPVDTHFSYPPDDMADFANFLTALAIRYKGQVNAYEIWNEPNLDYEWGNSPADPVAYTEMLKTAYMAIKRVDPNALVISGGLATTGKGSPTAYGDLQFMEDMYEAGAKGYFDALGSHPYAYGQPPDEVHPGGLSLARVEEQHRVMVAHDDGDTPIWITEVGWVLETNWNLGEHTTIGVTQEQQAEYLTRAYDKVQQEWPFVQAVFLFNLDFSTVHWYPAPEPMRWYSILNPDRTPRPAYIMLRQNMRAR